jgi:molybdopterin-guanine dinucleotide biosynthesis protein A
MERREGLFILAGGRSSRFGRDKTRFTYRFLYQKFRKWRPIFVTKTPKFPGYPHILEWEKKRYAPIFPLLQLLKLYPSVVVIPADVPLLSPRTLRRLLYWKRVSPLSPLVGVYLRRRDWAKLRRRAKGDLRLKGVAPVTPNLQPSPLQFLNINRPEDWERFINSPIYPRFLKIYLPTSRFTSEKVT